MRSTIFAVAALAASTSALKLDFGFSFGQEQEQEQEQDMVEDPYPWNDLSGADEGYMCVWQRLQNAGFEPGDIIREEDYDESVFGICWQALTSNLGAESSPVAELSYETLGNEIQRCEREAAEEQGRWLGGDIWDDLMKNMVDNFMYGFDMEKIGQVCAQEYMSRGLEQDAAQNEVMSLKQFSDASFLPQRHQAKDYYGIQFKLDKHIQQELECKLPVRSVEEKEHFLRFEGGQIALPYIFGAMDPSGSGVSRDTSKRVADVFPRSHNPYFHDYHFYYWLDMNNTNSIDLQEASDGALDHLEWQSRFPLRQAVLEFFDIFDVSNTQGIHPGDKEWKLYGDTVCDILGYPGCPMDEPGEGDEPVEGIDVLFQRIESTIQGDRLEDSLNKDEFELWLQQELSQRLDNPYYEYHQLLLVAEGEGKYGQGVTTDELASFIDDTKAAFAADCSADLPEGDECELRNSVTEITGLSPTSTADQIDSYFEELLEISGDLEWRVLSEEPEVFTRLNLLSAILNTYH